VWKMRALLRANIIAHADGVVNLILKKFKIK
jgi:hypothetical protein